MSQFLTSKNIVVGVTGSIAAYKSADLVRKLKEAGANVRVVMSKHAKEFITPLTMQAVSGNPIHDDLFDLTAEAAMGHIELARWADLILIAPATADMMAKLVIGQADSLLTTLCLATSAPVALAPAMNQAMWRHPQTQANQETLYSNGIHFFGPEAGSQACGDTGPGRMMEPADLVEKINQLFSNDLLSGKRVLITAGPTQEAIDPIRYLSNRSSGKMGYALAVAAKEAGASVTLISGPVALMPPKGVATQQVTSALEMHAAVMEQIAKTDIFIAVAAVADYRPATLATQKMKKTEGDLELTLTRNPDIVAAVGQLQQKPYIIGFAAETENLTSNAKLKRQRKNMNMIVANQISADNGMGCDENAVIVITEQEETILPKMAKTKLATKLIELMANDLKQEGENNGNTFRECRAG